MTLRFLYSPDHIWSQPLLWSMDLCSDWLKHTDLLLWLGDLWLRQARPKLTLRGLLQCHSSCSVSQRKNPLKLGKKDSYVNNYFFKVPPHYFFFIIHSKCIKKPLLIVKKMFFVKKWVSKMTFAWFEAKNMLHEKCAVQSTWLHEKCAFRSMWLH